MAKIEFDPTIKKKIMGTAQYIIHLKNVHEMSEQAGIPMGADALFGKYGTNDINVICPISTEMPSEPIENDDDWFTKEKQKGYSMGAQ